MAMTLDEVHRRQRAKVNELVRQRNQATAELDELRGRDNPSAARIAELRASVGHTDALLVEERSKRDVSPEPSLDL